MDNKIDLDGIRKSIAKLPGNRGEGEFTDACMKEAIRQALVLASEKAKVRKTYKEENSKIKCLCKHGVDKQSILDVNDLVV